jgi:hypothetical protein
MRLHLYGEQTGQSQAARGFGGWPYSLLGGSKFSGDRADREGKSCEGHPVGSSVWESDRGYAKGGKAEGGAEVAIDELCTYTISHYKLSFWAAGPAPRWGGPPGWGPPPKPRGAAPPL